MSSPVRHSPPSDARATHRRRGRSSVKKERYASNCLQKMGDELALMKKQHASEIEAMEEQRTAALVAERTHEVVTQELETERKRLVSAAERKAEEMRIQTETESQQG